MMNKKLQKAYVERSTNVEDRISCAFYCLFFCRIWKFILISIQNARKKSSRDRSWDSYPSVKIAKCFISSNLHTCIELNANSLLRFLIYCRDFGLPMLFLPYMTGSQSCENMFSTLRSLATIFDTKINTDSLQFQQRVLRIKKSQEIKHSLDGFIFPRKNRSQDMNFVHDSLPSNDVINRHIENAFSSAKSDLACFRKFSNVRSTLISYGWHTCFIHR